MLSGNDHIPHNRKIESGHLRQRFLQLLYNTFEGENERLEKYSRLITYAEPVQILKMGFSITRKDGKALKDVTGAGRGTVVETELYRGKFKSKITDIKKKNII